MREIKDLNVYQLQALQIALESFEELKSYDELGHGPDVVKDLAGRYGKAIGILNFIYLNVKGPENENTKNT